MAYQVIMGDARKKRNKEFCQKLFEGSADEVGVAKAVIDEVKKEVQQDDRGHIAAITYYAGYHYTAHGKDGKTYDCKVTMNKQRTVPIEVYNQGAGACLTVRYLLEAPGAVRLEAVADEALQPASSSCLSFSRLCGPCGLVFFLVVFVFFDMFSFLMGGFSFHCFHAVELVAAIGFGHWHAQQKSKSWKMSEFGVSKDVTVTIADGRASTDLGQALLSGA